MFINKKRENVMDKYVSLVYLIHEELLNNTIA